MTARTIESLPGFLGWFLPDDVPAGAAHVIEGYGLRKAAAFEKELEPEDQLQADLWLSQMPREFEPIHEAYIAVFTYYCVMVDVAGLHLQPDSVAGPVHRLLDPTGRLRLSQVMVSRVRRVFLTREAAQDFLPEAAALGLSCSEIEEREGYSARGIYETEEPLRLEVERRRKGGGAFDVVPPPESVRALERWFV